MNQCLRCNRPCGAASIFCGDCLSHLQDQKRQGEHASVDLSSIATAPLVLLKDEPQQSQLRESRDTGEGIITIPLPVLKAPQTPSPSAQGGYDNIVEQTMNSLHEAARRIAAAEQQARHVLRASRLAPLRDISAEIQRHSTPFPRFSRSLGKEQQEQDEDLGSRLPDLWPWLQDTDENEQDSWANYTDPLLSRRFPDSAEIARIEEEDMRRAVAQGVVAPPGSSGSPSRHLRIAFICLTVLAVLALGVDSALVSFTLLRPHRPATVITGPPILTVSIEGQAQSSNVASYGQTVILHLRHFPSDDVVFLTHDIEIPLRTNINTPFVHVGRDGAANVSTIVDTSWQPGFHTLQAEDQVTRYTASAKLLINSGPTPPPHLLVRTPELDFGPAVKGANSIQPLTLENSGSGAITWSASSDQPWLMLTPTQGVFSDTQTIAVGVERTLALSPKEYTGKITFSSNVGKAFVAVKMAVRALPANAPVLTVAPPVLSFIALDGGANPASQQLVVSNPGSQPLSWSLTNNTPTILANQNMSYHSLGESTNWLTLDRVSGVVVPGSTTMINVSVYSRNLLPGTYINTLVFSAGHGTVDSPQSVSVSLTIQPRCGLALSSGSMSFTTVAGQNNPSSQTLGLTATSSCTNTIEWQTSSSANWLTITPARGQLSALTSTSPAVGVNALSMKPGTYSATISVMAGQNTQSVQVLLTVQAPLSPTAPIINASPLVLNFSTTQGQSSPPGQVVTVTNTGQDTLQWHTMVNQLVLPWLSASPTGGAILPGQTESVTVNVDTTNLTPGTYVGQVVLSGTDAKNPNITAGGSPQTVTVNLLVLPPCTLAQPSSSVLAFSTTQGTGAPAPQSVAFTASGNCEWPLGWNLTVSHPAPWLNISPVVGSFGASGQSSMLTVAPSIAGLKPGTYTTQISIAATDASTVPVQGSPQTVSVVLTVFQQCMLQLPSSTLSFNVVQGQVSSSQTLKVKEGGKCATPVSWTAVGDAGSTAWLALSATSGTNSGPASTINVSANAATLSPGKYTGTITISASGSNGAIVQGSPQTVSVSLVVTGFTMSGQVNACADTTCATPTPLAGATVNLVNSSGTVVASVSANTSGNYTLTGIGLGTYTLSASGTDSSGTHYVGSISFTMTGNQQNVIINTIPGSAT